MDCIKVVSKRIDELFEKGVLTQKTAQILRPFIKSYVDTALMSQVSESEILHIFNVYLERLEYLHHHPFSFQPFHKQITTPFDYFSFGMQFVRPLVNEKISSLLGWDVVDKIAEKLKKKENVVLLANHQTEIDPHLINLLLEEKYPKMAKEMIFVAGDRVILDHLAVPASMGRNLLCIFSKKHINNPPSKMEQKRNHNRKTMERLSELLKEGGMCIYVAPSGGRDRPNENGEFTVAPLDHQSIELFNLMAKKSNVPCHFHTLALLTHRVLPPPNDVEIELGEERSTSYSGVYAYFGEAIDMSDSFGKNDGVNKTQIRQARSLYIWNQINRHYHELIKLQEKHEKVN